MMILDEQEKTNLMIQSLNKGLSNIYGNPTEIARLDRQPSKKSNSFATERVQVVLKDGEMLNIFFKDLNPDNMLKVAKKIRQHGLERSHRELFMYKDVLSQLRLGTPKLYGYRWEPKNGIYWIFIEDAGPRRLQGFGDFSLWVDAARWIARLHAIDISGIDDKEGFLPKYNDSHYTLCRQRMLGYLPKFNDEQQEVISRALESYNKINDFLNDLPLYVIHGEYFGKNVMIRPGEEENKIAVIDWETAALGPRCIDLVSISAGRWTPEERQIMYENYVDQYEIETGEKIDMNALVQELKNVAIYRAIWWLGYWANGDDAHITRWIEEMKAVLA